MGVELLSLGVEGVIAVNRVVAIVRPKSAPIERLVRQAREEGLLIDMTYGRRTEAVVFFDSGHVALVTLGPEEVVNLLKAQRGCSRHN